MNIFQKSQQVELFILRDYSLDQFTRLKAFSLYHVLEEEIMDKISSQLKHLSSLTYLSIIQCCLPYSQLNISFFFNGIWNLPKLAYCNLDIYLQSEEHFIAPTMISSSLEYLSIKGLLFEFDQINLLFERTPCLRYLKVNNNHVTEDIDPISSVSSLITLNISLITTNKDAVMNFLQSMINLHQLTVDIYGVCIDGYNWEQIIRNYLPNLKIFRLKEQISVVDQNQGDQKVDTLLKSFQNEFWLSEHKWFIRCDWNLVDAYSFISLYTLPYSFTEFTIDYLLISKSTSPQDINYQSYHRVQKLNCNVFSNDDVISGHLHFPSLRHLTTELPLYDYFRFFLPKLDQLSTLDISLTTLSQWEILLNRAINLHSLTINASSSSIIISFIENINISVCRLNLQVNDQCKILIKSPLVIQCEILAIDIKSCNSILDLVDNMINLRALKVRCEDDEWDFNLLLFGNDDFINWLRTCLPSSCSITRDLYSLDNIHFWIR